MSTRPTLSTLIVGASALIMMAAPDAFAFDNLSVIGDAPTASCAQAASVAAEKGTASRDDLMLCNGAIHEARNEPQSSQAAAVLNRGVLHLARAEYVAAVADFTAALRIQGDLSQAFVDRGLAYAAQHQFDQAVADFTKALDLKPALPAKIYFDRAMANEDKGDARSAYLDYLKAAQLDPAWDGPKAELKRFTVIHAGMS